MAMDFDMYWNPYILLPYQRNFMFVNSTRKDGKTYGTQYMFIDRFLKKGEQFVQVLRTDQEIKSGEFEASFEKVCIQQFPDYSFLFKGNEMWLAEPSEKDETKLKPVAIMGFALPLSQAVKKKKMSFPRVKWMYMDEYMLEPEDVHQYVGGWKEPDKLLSLYHTVDAEEDRVKIFLLGNNTSFYNPYHLHPAFKIPWTEPGKIWKSDNVLFQHYVPSDKLARKKEESKFLNMIKGTEYGEYALEGTYIGDSEEFIAKRPQKSQFVFKIKLDNSVYGIWGFNQKAYVSNKVIDSSKLVFAMSKKDLTEETIYIYKQNKLIKWMLAEMLHARVFYEDQEIKAKVKPQLERLI